VSIPVTHWNCFLFSFKSPLVLLDPCQNPSVSLSPGRNFQYFLWSLFVQSLSAFLAVPAEVKQTCSDPISRHSACNFSVTRPFAVLFNVTSGNVWVGNKVIHGKNMTLELTYSLITIFASSAFNTPPYGRFLVNLVPFSHS
jgi:hypothetical protein